MEEDVWDNEATQETIGYKKKEIPESDSEMSNEGE